MDELLKETAALLTIFSERLYTLSYYPSLLEEDSLASAVLAALDIDEIDRILLEESWPHRATETASADLLDADDDDQAFLQALTRRLAANSPLREIACEFSPAPQDTRANIGAKRLDDILTSLMEGMAGTGAKHLRLGTRVTPGWVDIRLSSRERIDPGAFG